MSKIKKRILLVEIITKNNKLPFNLKFIPLGLEIIRALIPKKRYITSYLLDYNYKKFNIKDFRRYDLILFSSSSFIRSDIINIVNAIKKKLKTTIIIGGPDISRNKGLYKRLDAILIVGEVEEIWSYVLKDFESGNLKKIYFGNIVSADSIPLLDYKPFLAKKNYVNTIQTTRGCCFNCAFCDFSFYNGNKIRSKSIDLVIREISLLKNRKIPLNKFFIFVDANIYSNKYYFRELCETIIKNKLDIYWLAEASANIGEDKELIELAYKSGCRALLVGFETINNKSLKWIRKPFSLQLYNKYINNIKTKKILIYGQFIIGLDYDNNKNYYNYLSNWLLKSKIDLITLSVLRPERDTLIYNRLVQENRILDEEKNIFIPRNMAFKELYKYKNRIESRFYSYKIIFIRILSLLKYDKFKFKYIIYGIVIFIINIFLKNKK
ncbi:MAG: B12-binding domain-containing radical SAM protein [Candidatus Woesearchaeota archaeon]